MSEEKLKGEKMKTSKDMTLKEKKKMFDLYFNKMYSMEQIYDYFDHEYSYATLITIRREMIKDGYAK